MRVKVRSPRQRIRKGVLLLSFLVFPLTMNYFSPYLIIDGASQGIASGSMIVFGLMFLSALVVGRLWCGWACPAGALGEMCFPVNDRPVNVKKIGWIKWAVWIPWIAIIAAAAVMAGGIRQVDPLLGTEGGISLAGSADRPIVFAYIIYFGVIGLFALLAVFAGRRAGCHTVCWMAPFMILGRKVQSAAALPALRLRAQPDRCGDCHTCSNNCPMSLDVNGMVKLNQMENSDCILCGSCVDNCPTRAIRYAFELNKSPKPARTPAAAGD
jgi:ferredoxin-type protein NapH